jgi:hypothetical protein
VSNFLLMGDCFAACARNDILYATSCLFIRAIAHAALSQDFVFGGKEIAGDGTPEGLPLISRFFHPWFPAVQLLVNQRRLAPSR